MPDFRFKQRGYLHFDTPLSAREALALVTNPSRVAEHSFLPLLGYTIVTPRISRDDQGRIVREGKERDIKICAHRDAAIYSYYAHLLSEHYETELKRRDLCSIVTAFRRMPGRQMNNVAFADEVFKFIQANRPCIAIGLDVKKFFDRLNHEVLLEQWKQLLDVDRLTNDHFAIYKNLTSFCWVDRKEIFRRFKISIHNPFPKSMHRRRICSASSFRKVVRHEGYIKPNPELTHRRGIPQGTPISAILSNIYMLEFDSAMQSKAMELGGLYRRYCDDIIFVSPLGFRDVVENFAKAEVAKLKLDLHPDKTCIVEYPNDTSLKALHGQVLQYLGFTFDGTQKFIRASSLSRYYGKMRRGVRLAKLHQLKHNKIEISRGEEPSPLKRRKVFIQYSYLIKRRFKNRSGKKHGNTNFITYSLNAAERMEAPEIKKQVRNHMKAIRKELRKPLPVKR